MRRLPTNRIPATSLAVLGVLFIAPMWASAWALSARLPVGDRAVTRADARLPGDSSEVAGVVGRFHRALASGDAAAAMRLLASDVVILESGDEETRARYEGTHLAADIDFSRATHSARGAIRVVVMGDAAWATSTDITTGTFHGRAVNSSGAELMVLARTAEGWRIRAIHWSSHARRAAR